MEPIAYWTEMAQVQQSFALAGRGDRALGCLPCLLHWFLPEEGCRGRREEAATLTPRWRCAAEVLICTPKTSMLDCGVQRVSKSLLVDFLSYTFYQSCFRALYFISSFSHSNPHFWFLARESSFYRKTLLPNKAKWGMCLFIINNVFTLYLKLLCA